MKTHTLFTNDFSQEEDLLQRYQERVVKVLPQVRPIKFCTKAGFLTTVDVGQYFNSEDTEEFSQFTDSLPRVEKFSEPKGWIRGRNKIAPVLKENSHSWV